MQPRALGRFLAEFLEGFAGNPEPEAAKPEAPIVVPVDMVRQAVADFLKPMVEAAAEEEPPPTAEQLNLLFEDARPRAEDELAEMTLRRVQQMREEQARRDQEARNQGAVPETFDPNDPGPKPWMAAAISRDAIERNTA